MRSLSPTLFLGLAALLAGGCGDSSSKEEGDSPPGPTVTPGPDGDTVKRLVATEECVLQVTPLLNSLAQSLIRGHRRNLPEQLRDKVPVSGSLARELPATLRDSAERSISPVPLQTARWPLESGTIPSEVPPWSALAPTIVRWTDARFGILKAELITGKDPQFITETKFEGRGIGRDRKLVGVTAQLRLIWKRSLDGSWSLTAWEQKKLEVIRTASPLFEEVLETALPDGIALERARRSLQEERTIFALQNASLRVEKQEYADLGDMENTHQYPSLSVVDYDGDGHDDLFLTARWSPPQLLRNRGDGTFEDVTIQSGLRVENCVMCALFADFDNDGDPDVLLGRSIEPTRYFVNEDGVFHDATDELTDLGDQYFVSAASVTDINRDGLLDLYLSTYSPGDDVLPIWKERYLTREVRAGLEKFKDFHPYFDDRGIANVLLMNRGGGRLERATPESLKLWRKSYQSVWADVDGDGDDDVYVCNDFAPDSFLENRTPKGAKDPLFVEALAKFFPNASMAFGMGASFADYDNDGDLDLYVSNMYSKAGNRIIEQVGVVDPRIAIAARGNFLYRNEGGTFQEVAEELHAAKVGWAFGGQFADFNNDGRLDLYVPSGFYTAPGRVATQVDL